MKIGVDISQLAYGATGVPKYLRDLLNEMISLDKKNEYILFFSSLRRELPKEDFFNAKNVTLKRFRFPPSFLNIIWNKYHAFPIENFIGDVDIFITSDWTEPPIKSAKKATILYDLTIYTHPEDTHERIIDVQKRKLEWVKKESDVVFCISEATKKDAMTILGIAQNRLKVVYPGI